MMGTMFSRFTVLLCVLSFVGLSAMFAMCFTRVVAMYYCCTAVYPDLQKTENTAKNSEHYGEKQRNIAKKREHMANKCERIIKLY